MSESSAQSVPEQEVGGYALAERLTGLKRSTLYSLVCQKRIPHSRLSGRLVRFRASELVQWLDEHRVAVAVGK